MKADSFLCVHMCIVSEWLCLVFSFLSHMLKFLSQGLSEESKKVDMVDKLNDQCLSTKNLWNYKAKMISSSGWLKMRLFDDIERSWLLFIQVFWILWLLLTIVDDISRRLWYLIMEYRFSIPHKYRSTKCINISTGFNILRWLTICLYNIYCRKK